MIESFLRLSIVFLFISVSKGHRTQRLDRFFGVRAGKTKKAVKTETKAVPGRTADMMALLTLPSDSYTIRPLCGAINHSHKEERFFLIEEKLDTCNNTFIRGYGGTKILPLL